MIEYRVRYASAFGKGYYQVMKAPYGFARDTLGNVVESRNVREDAICNCVTEAHAANICTAMNFYEQWCLNPEGMFDKYVSRKKES